MPPRSGPRNPMASSTRSALISTSLPAIGLKSRRPSWLTLSTVAFAAAVLQRHVLHGEMNPRQVAARHGQIARTRGAAGQHERIEPGAHLVHRHLDADVAAGAKRDAFVAQDL